jgi:hypothetical protein
LDYILMVNGDCVPKWNCIDGIFQKVVACAFLKVIFPTELKTTFNILINKLARFLPCLSY